MNLTHFSASTLLKSTLALAAVSLITTSNAQAQAPEPEIKTISYFDDYSAITDWTNVPFTLTQFDPQYGTLLSVEITITSSVTTTISLTNNTITEENPEGSTTSGWVNTNYTFFLNDPILAGNPPLINALAVPELSGVPARGVQYTLLAGEQLTIGPISRTANDSKIYSTSGILTYFTGAGSVVLSGTTFTDTNLQNTGGNTGSDQETYSDAVVTVKYTYEAIPEPGTWAALALGVGVLAASRRFRRKV